MTNPLRAICQCVVLLFGVALLSACAVEPVQVTPSDGSIGAIFEQFNKLIVESMAREGRV